MVNFCAVYGCTNRSSKEKSTSFYRIPKVVTTQGQEVFKLSTERRRKWLAAINRKDLNEDKSHYRVCSDHFITGKPCALFQSTDPDWAPSLNMGHSNTSADPAVAKQRHSHLQERRKRKELHHTAESLITSKKNRTTTEPDSNEVAIEDTCLVPNSVESGTFNLDVEKGNEPGDLLIFSNLPGSSNASTETELSSVSINVMEEELTRLNVELYTLREQNNRLKVGTVEWFEGKDEKVTFYTGLPNLNVLMIVFNFLEVALPHRVTRALTPFQEFTLTLLRLRLNLTLKDLAYRFNISKTTASSIFLKWLDIMFVRLRPLIKWPERCHLWETTPLSFRKHFKTKVAIIIDYFEIFIHKPANLLARATTWSHYKHHNTVKFLIGISPQGVIAFISKAWGGRVSDKHLTEHSGLLSHLLPGDCILADRGFDIEDSAAVYCAEVKIPAFTRGKKQLSTLDVERSRRIASLRVHVERVIGNVRKKYKILQMTLPLDYLTVRDAGYTTIDKIAIVCCALTNMCDSVIPFE